MFHFSLKLKTFVETKTKVRLPHPTRTVGQLVTTTPKALDPAAPKIRTPPKKKKESKITIV